MTMTTLHRLREAILERYGSQERFAAAIGINEAIMSKYCRGIRAPHERHIQIITEALGATADELFPGMTKGKEATDGTEEVSDAE